jgi:arylsulfatase A-like enzyme
LEAKRLRDYGRFVAQVAGAGFLGGALAGAAEYVIGVAAGRGGFWGVPRHFYQILLGAEVLWAAALAGALCALGGSVYYAWGARRGRKRLASAPIFVVAVALCGAPALYFLATVDHPHFYLPAKAKVIVPLVVAAVLGAWAAATWGVYSLVKKIMYRANVAGAGGVAAVRLLAVILLVPFVGAELWALWRARERSPPKPDIYIVVMDAFRADRLSYYGATRCLAPALENFAADAVVFGEAFTVSLWTKPVIASIFTSSYPSTHGVNARFSSLPPDAVTLAEALREQGYLTVAASANLNVSRYARTADGFDVLDNARDGTVLEAAGPPTTLARALVLTRSGRRSFLGPLWRWTTDGMDLNRRLEFWQRLSEGRPRFFYIHYMEPHNPNPPRAEYMAELQPLLAKVKEDRAKHIAVGHFFFDQYMRDPAFSPDYDDDEVALATALYDADIRRMDAVIADLLRNAVTSARGAPEPIVVITADHGEEFLEHGRWLHGASLHQEMARIPLVIKAPGCPAAVLAGPVNLVDVAPTAVSLAGGAIPEGWQGLDLTPHIARGSPVPPRPLLLEGIQVITPATTQYPEGRLELNGLVAGEYYYLRDENAAAEFLYHREHDPRQRNNLASSEVPSHQAALSAGRAALARLKRQAEERAYRPGKANVPPRVEGGLRALGYIN